MKTILFINACARSDSRTLELANSLLKKIGGSVKEMDLFKTPIRALDLDGLKKREQAENNDFSDSLFDVAKEFAAADTIVIAAPYWDMMFPSVLKVYLENITVCGITFRYSPEGRPQGLCKATSLYYVTTAGGFIGPNDFGFAYVKALSENFFGIPETFRFSAEGLDIKGADIVGIIKKAKAEIEAMQEKPEGKTISPFQKQEEKTDLEGAYSFRGSLNHVHSQYYVANDFYHMKSNQTLHILSQFKTYQQTTEYTCGAVSALMVLNWFGKEKYREKAIAQLIETHESKGSSVENIADFFDLIGWNVEFHANFDPKFKTIEEAEQAIIHYIDRGIPIMIDWVDWAGHWQVLVGIDTCGTDSPYDDVLIFADPYDVTDHSQDGYYTYPLGRFFGMWREGPCSEKKNPYRQPFVAAWPKDELSITKK